MRDAPERCGYRTRRAGGEIQSWGHTRDRDAEFGGRERVVGGGEGRGGVAGSESQRRRSTGQRGWQRQGEVSDGQ